MSAAIPSIHFDLYATEQLLDPFEGYRRLRDLGPLVYLENLGMYVASRYRDVKEILSRPDVFISGKGVMMNDTVNGIFAGGIGLCSDGAEHRRIRSVESRPLSPRALRALRDTITAEAETVVDEIARARRFDAVTRLAQYLPLRIVSNLVGLPEEGRERMLVWAAANFDSFGPLNERAGAALSVFDEMVNYAMTQAVPEKLKPGSWAAMLHEAAAAGEVSDQEARLMALSYVAPSLDTTIFATASAVWLFARHPEQWRLLRDRPTLIPNAINEVVRLESPIQGFSRYAVEDYDLDGAVIPKDSRVIILYGSANRDERRWDDGDMFDIQRQGVEAHVGFGHGEHVCIGNNLARMEMAALFTALIPKVERFELGDAERVLNSTLRGFSKLDVTIH
jgi:cytochrome P450